MEAKETSREGTRRVLRSIVPGFDPASVRCAAESRMWAAIEKDEDFCKRLTGSSTEREAALVRGNLELLTDAYRVDTALTPAIHKLREALRTTLRIVRPIDVYVRSAPDLNAFCVPARKGTRLVMCLHSSLFYIYTAPELLFVMAHEAAHALFDHGRIPRIPFGHPDFSPLEVMKVSALSRRRELSCDRVGLLACQDPKAACSALFKLMSGLPDRWTAFDEKVLARHFDNVSEVAAATGLDDAATTHPITLLRVKALLEFSESKVYSEALGLPPGPVETEDLERSSEHLLSILEPDLTSLETASEEEAANEVLSRGALAIIAADGAVDPAEAEFLVKVLGADKELINALTQPNFTARVLADLAGPAAVVAHKLPANGRASLLYRLCTVALLAGGYSEQERNAMIAIAQMLHIPPDLYHQVVETAIGESESPAATPEPKRKKKKN